MGGGFFFFFGLLPLLGASVLMGLMAWFVITGCFVLLHDLGIWDHMSYVMCDLRVLMRVFQVVCG
jgi:hypothetical protein